MMHNIPDAASLLCNVYSEKNRGDHLLDSMRACVNENRASENITACPSCAAITDVLELKLVPGPVGLLFLPIFPANAPTVLVGLTTTSIHWREVLESVVPNYVNGLTCVVATKNATFACEIQNGHPVLQGKGTCMTSATTALLAQPF